MAQQAQQAQPNPEITDASKKRKRNPGVRATREQTEVLQAAYEIDKSYSNEELDKLSLETGLTSQWIKSWFVRHKKKNQKERGSSEPDADVPPPPKKRGRRRNDPPTSTTHRIEAPAAKEPPAGNTSLPPLDHSLMPPSKPPSPAHTPASRPDSSFPSSSLSVELNPLRHPVQQPPAGYVNYGGFYMDPRYLPSRLPEQQKPSRSNSQYYPSSSYQNLPSSGPMLLPRMPENINPAPQRVSDQEYPPNAWGTYASPGINPPIRRSTVPPGALLGPHGRNTPASPALDTTPSLKSTTSFALTPAAVLHTPSPFVLNQQPPSQGTPTEPPFYMRKNTPAHVLQSPLFESPFSTQPFKPTNSMISPSALRSYMPEHDVEQNDSTSSTDSSFDTPIADKFLFSTVIMHALPRCFLP
ncbi:hypothetical protein DFH09DRAFT_1228917 [Mycena vulgaris]|nr:hypothetical protein DFH09DRAFT_1228917 [Mycena vulgaris]